MMTTTRFNMHETDLWYAPIVGQRLVTAKGKFVIIAVDLEEDYIEMERIYSHGKPHRMTVQEYRDKEYLITYIPPDKEKPSATYEDVMKVTGGIDAWDTVKIVRHKKKGSWFW